MRAGNEVTREQNETLSEAKRGAVANREQSAVSSGSRPLEKCERGE